MKAYVQGTALTIAVPLTRDGEPFVADAATVNWTLHGQDGTQLATGQITTAADSTVQVPIDQQYTSIANGNSFEKRTLVLSGTVDSNAFVVRQAFQLIPWINFTATTDDVRSFIGIGPGELPDSDIDLVSAYMDVCSYSTQAIVDAALVAANQNEIEANRAIVARAVLISLPSLQSRISAAESDGTIQVKRQPIDLAGLEDRAAQQLSRSLDIFAPRLVEIPATIVVTQRDDIFWTRPWCVRS